MPFETVNEFIETIVEGDGNLQKADFPNMTKERYKLLMDKEKVEWLGITECSVQDAIQRFIIKLDSIGVVYRYSDDMLDEFMRLEAVMEQMRREERAGEKEQERKIEPKKRVKLLCGGVLLL